MITTTTTTTTYTHTHTHWLQTAEASNSKACALTPQLTRLEGIYTLLISTINVPALMIAHCGCTPPPAPLFAHVIRQPHIKVSHVCEAHQMLRLTERVVSLPGRAPDVSN